MMNSRSGMSGLWLAAVLAQLGALVLWALGLILDLATLMPVAFYAGTIAPSSCIVADMGRRFLPVAGARLFGMALGLLNVGVLASIAVVHFLSADGPFQFISSVSVALWGAASIGLALSAAQVILCGLMARNYFRVRSARTKGVGAVLVAVGTMGHTLPLMVFDVVFYWPLFTLPAIIISLMGQRRLDL